MLEVRVKNRFEDWRSQARQLLDREIPPIEAHFIAHTDSQLTLDTLFATPEKFETQTSQKRHVSAAFITQARFVSVHRDDNRWNLLYRILWRLTHGEPQPLSIFVDPDTAQFQSMYRSVRRDMHKMTAFVRFRETRTVSADDPDDSQSWFVAWYEPDHRILPLTARFFVQRFNGMRFSILTPDDSLHWNGQKSTLGPGCPRSHAPAGDEVESLWKTYYASIFNPARIKERAMKKELPVRYWKNLPETALISELIRQAPARLQEFYKNQPVSTENWLPPVKERTLPELQKSVQNCRACTICENATQAVFGEGPSDATLVIIGEQPGDQEDLAGRPFVGPAGQLLDRALLAAGIDRKNIYVTNAVKHFKWKPRGKVRLHQNPSSAEIGACKPWLTAELAIVQPQTLICLGASAAQSIMGKAVTLRDIRGQKLVSAACENTWITAHPSAILRIEDPAAREQEFLRLVKELCQAAMLHMPQN